MAHAEVLNFTFWLFYMYVNYYQGLAGMQGQLESKWMIVIKKIITNKKKKWLTKNI